MKIHSLGLLALVWISGPVSATLIDYNFSGEFDVAGGCFVTGTYCGAYTGMITIDDAQLGTGTGPLPPPSLDGYIYEYENFMITLVDDTVLTDDAGTFFVRTNGSTNQLVSFVANTGASTPDVTLFWMFAIATFDTSSIVEVLGALQSEVTSSIISLSGTSEENCFQGGCSGTLSALTAPVPIPPALWLFGSGLLGLVGIARRKMTA